MIRPFSSDPFAFYYHVEEEGYDWINGRLIGLGGLGSRLQWRVMPSGLFLEFAALTPEADNIRQFANRYGDIFERYDVSVLVAQRDTLKGGSTLKTWAAEIADMRVLVEIWRATEDKKHQKKLKEIITRKGKQVMYSIKTPRRAMQAWLDGSRFNTRDFVMPARYALQAEINWRLKEPGMQTTPRLIWSQERTKDRTTREGYQRLVFTPPNLLAALWLQFAQALGRKYKLKTCECGRIFIAGPGSGKREDSETCGNACRQRRYAKHKEKSLR